VGGDRAAAGAPGGCLHAADYRTRYERERPVPYGQWKKERSRYDRENRKAHKKWEKEREKEWKESNKGHGKNDKHSNHGGGHDH